MSKTCGFLITADVARNDNKQTVCGNKVEKVDPPTAKPLAPRAWLLYSLQIQFCPQHVEEMKKRHPAFKEAK